MKHINNRRQFTRTAIVLAGATLLGTPLLAAGNGNLNSLRREEESILLKLRTQMLAGRTGDLVLQQAIDDCLRPVSPVSRRINAKGKELRFYNTAGQLITVRNTTYGPELVIS